MAHSSESADRGRNAKISSESGVEKPVRLASRRRQQRSAGSFRGSNSASRRGYPRFDDGHPDPRQSGGG
jgi:hypothetical protein